MAAKEEMKTEYEFFGDVWRLFKKYYDPWKDDSYWEGFCNEASALGKKYESRLCKDLILAVMDELERRYNALESSE